MQCPPNPDKSTHFCGNISGMTIDQKKDFARTIYLHEPTLTQKDIAKRANVTEHTIGNWIKAEGWDKMRRSNLATRQKELANAYLQLEELNKKIMGREEGERVPNNKEADIQVKLAPQIRQLETQLSASDVMDVGISFIEHVRQVAPEKAAETLDLYDSFLKKVVKR